MINNSRQQSSRNVVLIGMMVGIYLLFSVGIVKATHFCMGREASVSFFTTETEKCACTDAASDKTPCCSDEQGLLKLKDSQKNFSLFEMSVPVLGLIGEIYTRNADPGREVTRAGIDTSDPPPARPSIYKLYCTYVFYGD